MSNPAAVPAVSSAAVRHPRAIQSVRSPIWPFVIMVLASLVPMEVRVVLGDQNFYPVRLAVFVLIPWFLRRATSGETKMHLTDWIMLALGTWMIFSFVAYYGFGRGFNRGFALAFDTVAPYFVARLCLRSLDDLRRVLVIAAPAFLAAGAAMAVESLTDQHLVRPFFAGIFGPLADYANGVAVGTQALPDLYRLGLMRADGPFVHPILGGVYLASLAPLYIWSGIRGWPKWVGIVASACAIFSVSSAAFLVWIVAFALIAYEFIQKRVDFFNWPLLIAGAALLITILQIGSQNGVIPILVNYTLDPATASYRLTIWEYGTASVSANPWIGIGYTDFQRLSWMGTSVDNQWLLIAMRHGVLAIVLAMLAIGFAISIMTRAIVRMTGPDRLFSIVLMCTFVSLTVAGLSVAFFGGFPAWFYGLQGCLVGVGGFEQERRDAARRLAANAARRALPARRTARTA